MMKILPHGRTSKAPLFWACVLLVPGGCAASPYSNPTGAHSKPIDFPNRDLIEHYTIYECLLENGDVEKELSFGVTITEKIEREGDNFPVYRVPENKMVWLSDWSFNVTAHHHHYVDHSGAGGSLGRITNSGEYVFVLNCAVRSGDMTIFSPARPIRYLPGETIAVCFHHLGKKTADLACRATMRFMEVDAPAERLKTRFGDWSAHKSDQGLDDWLDQTVREQDFRAER